MVPKPGLAMMSDDGFPAFDDHSRGEFSPQGVNDIFGADFTHFDTKDDADFNFDVNTTPNDVALSELSFTTPRPRRAKTSAAASAKEMALRNIVPDEARSPGPNARQHRRAEKQSPSSEQQQQLQPQLCSPLTNVPNNLRQSFRVANTRTPRRSPPQPRREDAATPSGAAAGATGGGEKEFELGHFLDWSQSEHVTKSNAFGDDDDDDKEEEEKSIYSMFQWSHSSARHSPSNTRTNPSSRDARSVDGDNEGETPKKPRQPRKTVRRKSGTGMTPLSTTSTTASKSEHTKKPLIDPKSPEAALLRDLLLHELENRVNSSINNNNNNNANSVVVKKKKKIKKKDDSMAPSEHSRSSTRKSASAAGEAGGPSKEYRRMQKKLSGGDTPTNGDIPSSKSRSSSSARTTDDIQFQPTRSDSRRGFNKNSLDIHFHQSQPHDDDDEAARPSPDVRSIFSSRSKMSQSESEASNFYNDDDGTVLQFDPTQEDHVAKRHIGREGSSFNLTLGLGDSLSNNLTASGFESNNNNNNHNSRMTFCDFGKSGDGRKASASGAIQGVSSTPLPVEADAAAGVAHNNNHEPPGAPSQDSFVSPAMTANSKGNHNSTKKRGFFVRRRSNEPSKEQDGDENGTVCSNRSEMTNATSMSAMGASASNNSMATSSRRLGGGGGVGGGGGTGGGAAAAAGGGASRRGTSLSMLRRRSASTDNEQDDRSAMSNNTDASNNNFRSRYSRRTSRRAGKPDRRHLLDDESDSDY